MKQVLDSNPDLLIVKSAGNDYLASGTYAQLPVAQRASLLTALLQLRDTATAYRDRILLVGSTDQNTARASFSNNFPEVEVYAPGVDIPLLRPNGAVITSDGTSFSTPMVAAIAGQLLAMDPLLSGASLKQLILDGARDSVENSSGVNELPARVGNTGSNVVYEADAYGSLRLLSSRSGTPLCGASLAPWRDPATSASSDSTGTRAIRYGAASTDFFPGFTLSPQSLAAGGRLIAFGPASRQRFAGNAWLAPEPYADGEHRLFGERDTLSYRSLLRPGDDSTAPGDLRLVLRPSGRTWTFLSALGIGGRHLYGQPSLSPDGMRVIVPFGTDSVVPNGGVNTDHGTSLAILEATTTQIALAPPGVSPFGRTAWTPDGTRAIFYSWGFPDSLGLQSAIVLVTFGSGPPTVRALGVAADRFPVGAYWSDEGHRLTLIDTRLDVVNGFSDCRRRDFTVSATALTLLQTTALDVASYCQSGYSDTPDEDYAKTFFPSGGGGGAGGGAGEGGGGGGISGRVLSPDHLPRRVDPRTLIEQLRRRQYPQGTRTLPTSAPSFF